MDTKYTNVVYSKALQNIPNLKISGLKIYHLATLLGTPFFSDYSFRLLTGMTGISSHMQWPLTSQLHGSVSQREQLV
jgi:hypothetical protein